jgi:hypothetical protein
MSVVATGLARPAVLSACTDSVSRTVTSINLFAATGASGSAVGQARSDIMRRRSRRRFVKLNWSADTVGDGDYDNRKLVKEWFLEAEWHEAQEVVFSLLPTAVR